MAAPRRILFLADINSVHTERWMRLLAQENISLALFSLSAKTTNWIDELNIPYRTFGLGDEVTRSQGDKSKLRYFKAHKEVKTLVSEWEPDIIHAHYATSYGMLAHRLKFKRTVLSLWGSDVYEFPRKSPVHKFFFKRIVKNASVVCSTSKAMAQEAAKYVNLDYRITPFGTDVDLFTPKQKKVTDSLIIGTVKSLEHVYGIDRLLKVYADFSKEAAVKTELHIYGKGSKESELKNLAISLGIESECKFFGFVQGEELVRAFQSLDIALMLSRSESFGVAALEAQACCVPTVVSNVGGLPEVCAHEDFVVDAEDSRSVLKLIHDLADEDEREKRGLQAREFVLSNYATKVSLKTFIETYDLV